VCPREVRTAIIALAIATRYWQMSRAAGRETVCELLAAWSPGAKYYNKTGGGCTPLIATADVAFNSRSVRVSDYPSSYAYPLLGFFYALADGHALVK
jgi:hypothetical protein